MAVQIWRNKNLCFQGLTFLLLFFLCLLFSALMSIDVTAGDAIYYWGLADETLASGHFRLLDFPETYRGYLFPLLLLGLKKIFYGIWGWRIFSALQIAIIFSVFLPIIFNLSFSVSTLLRALIAELFFLWVWGDFAQYPLSDLPAVFFFMAAICILSSCATSPLKIRNGLLWILAGVFLYSAYNTRVIYLYATIVALLFYILKERKKLVIIPILCVLVGVSIPAVPQCMINHKHVGAFSPKVYTERAFGYVRSLQMQQLFWGISYPKYETYLGDADKYPSPKVFFDDRVGQAILQRESLSADSFSYRSMALLFKKYPIDMVGIYTRHLVAIITPAWNEVYIYNLHTNKLLLVLSSIGLWLIAGLHLFSTSLRCSDLKKHAGYFVAIVTPALLAVLGATEIRFFLPGYLLLYGLVFLKVSYRDLFRYVRANKLKISAVLFIISILWITVFGLILAMNREQALLIGD